MNKQKETKDKNFVQKKYPIIVIGSGFSGVNMAITLQEKGYEDFLVLERADGLGGTWRDNIYPGCACDVPSMVYSYSFERNPEWSRLFSGSDEIREYIELCVAKRGLEKHFKFGVNIQKAIFDEVSGKWTLFSESGECFETKVVVSAVGGLVNPSIPEFNKMDQFQGTIMHTARWDRSIDLKGKKVAVIGTGASAVQVIPSIQPLVEKLNVIQRTPAWVIPKPDVEISSSVRKVFSKVPYLQSAIRKTLYALTETIFGPMVILDSPLSKILQRLAYQNLKTQVKDKTLREKLTPDFKIGCKRVLISSDYYPSLQKHNVDLSCDSVKEFTETGFILGKGKKIDADVVVLATGFKLDIDSSPFPIYGVDGVSLSDAWRQPGGKAYKGMTVSGFPNWFIMLGPNTGPGHTSVLFYTESQAKYIVQAIDFIFEKNVNNISIRKPVVEKYNKKIQGRMKYTSWTSGCDSWYLDNSGENHSLFPGLVSEYILLTRKFKDKEYDVVYNE